MLQELGSVWSELGHQLTRRLAGPRPPADSYSIGDEAGVELPLAFFDEDNLRNVRGYSPGTNSLYEDARLRQRFIKVTRATVSRHRDVIVDPERGFIFMRERVRRLAHEAGLPSLFKSAFRGAAASFVAAPASFAWESGASVYFGHAVLSELPLYRILRGKVSVPLYGLPRAQYPHLARYLQLTRTEFIPLAARAHFRELLLGNVPVHHPLWTRAVVEMGDLVRAGAAASRSGARSPALVYLSRGAGGASRAPSNEEELCALVRSQGGLVVRTDGPLEPMLGCLIEADVVISVEGSQLAHAFLALKPGATVVVLQSPFRFNNYRKKEADARGLRYATFVGEARGGGSYAVDARGLFLLLDRAVRSPR